MTNRIKEGKGLLFLWCVEFNIPSVPSDHGQRL